MSLDEASQRLFKNNTGSTSNKRLETKKDEKMSFKCLHYFGYLSKKSRESNFPEECLVCPKAVKCIFVPSVSLNADLHMKSIRENEIREFAQLF